MKNREEITKIFSELKEPQFKRAKTILKDKNVPVGTADSVQDADDMAELLMGHFPSGELKKHILDILQKTKSESVIEKYKDILSDPSQPNWYDWISTKGLFRTICDFITRRHQKKPEQDLNADSLTANGGTTSSSTEMNTTTGRSITTSPESMANTHQEPQQRIISNGGTTSSSTEMNTTTGRSITTTPESMANTHQEPQQRIILNGETTSSTTEVSATSSNTGVPVSAANKHPELVHVCLECGNKEVKHPFMFCAECKTKELDKFRLLLKKVSGQISPTETEDLKFLLSERQIYERKANDTALEIFLDLAKKGYISQTDQTLLIELLKGIERPDLVLLVKKYQNSVLVKTCQR